ncbi:TetR/AcrR family transcriptional regulator [Burkholderia mayonis]|uniref:TetR/AcrR family transcriptional regulator n=1 Tax=Burkholderia mayonis TaxID=1385591 RepID=UPI001CF7A9A0|nr:TetR/AcrR family transcriptional regulator [Burkholderia mayonis]
MLQGADLATRISRPADAMRREPRQKRSRVTIDSILDATAHVLGERGWTGLTTNIVADVAGVSIGSLYQYFPNKLGLVEAVRRRHFEEVLNALRTAANTRTPYAMRIEAFVDGVIAAHSRYPAAHKVLLEEAPRSADARRLHDEFGAWYEKGCRALVQCTAGAREGDDRLRISARVLASAVAGVVHDAAQQRTLDALDLRRELIALVESICKNNRSRRHDNTGAIAGHTDRHPAAPDANAVAADAGCVAASTERHFGK